MTPVTSRLLNITVPLTQALIDKNVGLRPEDVIPKLADDLHWAVEQVSRFPVHISLEPSRARYIFSFFSIADENFIYP